MNIGLFISTSDPIEHSDCVIFVENREPCQIGPKVYPWNDVIGTGETPNKAAADFEDKWKTKGLSAEMYSGPSWEGGIKPEKPAPAKPAVAKKPAAQAAAASPAQAAPVAASAPPPNLHIIG